MMFLRCNNALPNHCIGKVTTVSGLLLKLFKPVVKMSANRRQTFINPFETMCTNEKYWCSQFCRILERTSMVCWCCRVGGYFVALLPPLPCSLPRVAWTSLNIDQTLPSSSSPLSSTPSLSFSILSLSK